MNAVMLAGGAPQKNDALYPYTQGAPKALLDLAGKPMGQWVLDALSASNAVEGIVVVGLPPESGLHSPKIIGYLADEGDLLANMLAGLRFVRERFPGAEYTLLLSSDIPSLTSEAVDWVVSNASHLHVDLVYHVVTREMMERRFPGANRTFVRLKDVEVCGADVGIVRTALVDTYPDREVFERAVAARKAPFQMAAILGWKTLLMIALRQWTLQQVVGAVGAKLRIHGEAVISPYAEIAMDADKPAQVDLLRADLASHTH